MKKLILIPVFVLLFLTAKADGILSFGYQVGVTHLANINRTVYTYNYARPWLTQQMPFFAHAQGYQIHFAFMSNRWGMEAGVSTLVETNEAYGIETATGLEAHREIRIGQIDWSYGFRYILKESDHLDFGFTLSVDKMRLNGSTTYSNGQDSDFMRCLVEKTWGSSLRLNLSWYPINAVGFTLRPFVTLPWGKVNTEGLMYYLQGDYNTQRGYAWNYGCSLNLTFRFGHDKY